MTILVQQQMTESDRKQLRELCGKATQGDWWIDSHGHHLMSMDEIQTIFITDGKAMGPAVRHPETGNLSHWPNDWNASYIVAVQPKVVRGLLDEIDRLTRAAKYCEDIDATHENQRQTMLYDMALERDQLKGEIEVFEEGCRKLAFQLSAGGYNAAELTAEQLIAKVQGGLDLFCESTSGWVQKVEAERYRLKAENAELKADAERYRWLRRLDRPHGEMKNPGEIGWPSVCVAPGEAHGLCLDRMDEAIDKAMTKEGI